MREVGIGEKLDQYKLTEVIARSGMASIFKAIDRLSGETVAIKVPYLQFESDVVFYDRFQPRGGNRPAASTIRTSSRSSRRERKAGCTSRWSTSRAFRCAR